MFVKKDISDIGANKLIDACQIVYSDETLREIQRSSGYEDKFLDVLRKLDAFHLKMVVKQPGFVITDQATLSNIDPFQAFHEFCENTKEGIDAESMLIQELLKYSGGRKGDSIKQIHLESLHYFSNFIKESLKGLGVFYLPFKVPLYVFLKYQSLKLRITFKKYEKTIAKDVSDTRNWNPTKDFRSFTGLDPKILNNIEPPNVIEKIWSLYEGVFSDTDNINSAEDFFLFKSNPIYPERPACKHQQIGAIYQMLNIIGYEPDSKLHKEKRLVASLSDGSHSSMAAFCNAFMSKDKSLVLKTRAIYDCLQVKTKVIHVTEISEKSE